MDGTNLNLLTGFFCYLLLCVGTALVPHPGDETRWARFIRLMGRFSALRFSDSPGTLHLPGTPQPQRIEGLVLEQARPSDADIERAFWEFDAEAKRTGAARDAFKRQALALLGSGDIATAKTQTSLPKMGVLVFVLGGMAGCANPWLQLQEEAKTFIRAAQLAGPHIRSLSCIEAAADAGRKAQAVMDARTAHQPLGELPARAEKARAEMRDYCSFLDLPDLALSPDLGAARDMSQPHDLAVPHG